MLVEGVEGLFCNLCCGFVIGRGIGIPSGFGLLGVGVTRGDASSAFRIAPRSRIASVFCQFSLVGFGACLRRAGFCFAGTRHRANAAIPGYSACRSFLRNGLPVSFFSIFGIDVPSHSIFWIVLRGPCRGG